MDRLVRHNVLAMSGRAVEAAGDVDTLLLDKTGTITLGNRQATEFIPLPGVTVEELADAAQLASLADETPEGRSIVVLAKQFGIRGRHIDPELATFVEFTAQTRMSGLDLDGHSLRKGAGDAVIAWVRQQGGEVPPELESTLAQVSGQGGTPLAVALDDRALGVIHLKDIVKGGIRERFDQMRAMGIRTVMITGDNPLTAAVIAEEAGVDDFLAEATPEAKMELIKREQAQGKLVAMTGDGTNDAPALAQADVGVAMNTGTMAAKEAGNMVDLDSNPTKLIEIVEIGKQLLITRGALTTFSIANDVAKYFAIIPAMFVVAYPELDGLNVMQLHSADSAILSAVIFNAIIIVMLIPLALRGVKFRAIPAAATAPLQPARVRAGRHHRAVHRHQGHRPAPGRPQPGELGRRIMTRHLNVALRMTLVTAVLLGLLYPLAITGHRAGRVPRRRRREPGQGGRPRGRLEPDRAGLHRRRVLPPPALRGRRRLRRHGVVVLQPRPDQPDPHRPCHGRRADGDRRQPGPEDGNSPRGHGHHVGQRAGPAHHRGQRASAGAACGASPVDEHRGRPRAGRRRTREDGPSASSVSRA